MKLQKDLLTILAMTQLFSYVLVSKGPVYPRAPHNSSLTHTKNDVPIGLSLLKSVFVELYLRQADVSFNDQAVALPTVL